VTVGPGALEVARSPRLLRACGVGSSVVVSLWDPARAIGGLAHLPLPERDRRDAAPERYVDSGLDLLVARLDALGCSRERLEARAVGGAALLVTRDGVEQAARARRNVGVLRATLERIGLPVLEEHLGGNRARSVEFDTGAGSLRVESLDAGEAAPPDRAPDPG
jgi:chemotaxis protein CheD